MLITVHFLRRAGWLSFGLGILACVACMPRPWQQHYVRPADPSAPVAPPVFHLPIPVRSSTPAGAPAPVAPATSVRDSGVTPKPSGPVVEPEASDEAAVDHGVYPPYTSHPDEQAPIPRAIEGLQHLDYFYGQLTLTELKHPGAITRAGHFGDSVIGGDGLTFEIRQKLQARFGDAGHGYHVLSKYSIGYYHRGIFFRDGQSWKSCHIIFKCRPEMRYGYGGVTSSSSGGSRSLFRTTREGAGQTVSRFELWYALQPGGGRFQIRVDGKEARVLETARPELGDAVETIQVEDGPHEFEVRAIGGPVRGYGVVFERDVPGVVYDELSQIGSFTQRLDYQDAAHVAGQMARRDTDLLVFILGGNDVQRGTTDLKSDMSKYEAEYTRVLRKFRAGKPQTSCLIMTPIDHGHREGGQIRSRPIMFRLVAVQRKVAREQGCAFFDTFEAMGGEGAIGRWFQARPQLAAKDLVHPSLRGQQLIASWLYHALMRGYVQFRLDRTGQPLPALDVARPLVDAAELPAAQN